MTNRPVRFSDIEIRRLLHLSDDARDRSIELQRDTSHLPELFRRSEELVRQAKKLTVRLQLSDLEDTDEQSDL
jgi:hypothetical protein